MDAAENISLDAIQDLIESEKTDQLAVTIYLPIHRSSSLANINADKTRLRNLRSRVLSVMRRSSVSNSEVEVEFMKRIDALLNDQLFWQNQTEGLLICFQLGLFRLFYLPIECGEFIYLGDKFYLGPLMGIVGDFREYYLLVLTQHQPLLYRGNSFNLSQSNIKLPERLETGLQLDEMPKDNEQPSSSYNGSCGFNGRGGYKDIESKDRLKFWHLIDQVINQTKNKNLPLIIAGVDYEVAEYKNQSHYPNILTKHIKGSYRGFRLYELFDKSLNLVKQQIIDKEHNRLVDEYNRLSAKSPDLIARDLNTISEAANMGKIETLMIATIKNTTDGVNNESKRSVIISFSSNNPLAKMINKISRMVWANGGKILNVEDSLLPFSESRMLAVVRY